MKEGQRQSGIPFLNGIKDGIDAVIGASEFLIQKNQGSFEDYIERRSKELDEFILALEHAQGLTYAAGEVHLVLADHDEFYLEANFYFRDARRQVVSKTIKGKLLSVAWAFTPEFQTRLREDKKHTFEYERPTSC
jgi:hypothetical protein